MILLKVAGALTRQNGITLKPTTAAVVASKSGPIQPTTHSLEV